MSGATLPEDGPALIAGIQLPAGQRIYGMESGDEMPPIAWATSRTMADASDAFFALSAAHARTGLVPILLSGADGMDDIQEDFFGLEGSEDLSLIDEMDPEEVLAAQWDLGDEDTFDAYLERLRAPYGAVFPGLAPAERTRLPHAALRSAAAWEDPAHLALVAASRASDVPAAVGWSVFGVDAPGTPEARSLDVSTVLRSWETRFAARPLRIGGDSILLVLVEQPPSTLETATAVAAEHLAFADECDGVNGYPVSELAQILVGKPVWQFWWD